LRQTYASPVPSSVKVAPTPRGPALTFAPRARADTHTALADVQGDAREQLLSLLKAPAHQRVNR
jgi:hypothetical protein